MKLVFSLLCRIVMSNSSNSTKTGSTEKATSSQRPSGSGWQQAPSTPLFRLVNFELYVKQVS